MSELPGKKESLVTDEAVFKATGKKWNEWFSILDKASAVKMTHKDIAKYLTDNHEISSWWSQSVTVQYELSRGLRLKHQKPEGFQISKSKTISTSIDKAYNAWEKDSLRSKWLKDNDINITTANKNKSIRGKWNDRATTIEVNFYEKVPGKTQVVVQHSKIKTAGEAEKMKLYWQDALSKLGEYLQ